MAERRGKVARMPATKQPHLRKQQLKTRVSAPRKQQRKKS